MIDRPEPQVTEIAVRQAPSFFPTPQELTALKEQVAIYIASGLLPSHIKKPEQAITIALKGRELGIPPLKALSKLYVVGGKVGMEAELMLDLIRERCPTAVIEIVRSDDKACVLRASRNGHKASEFAFTEADAQKAGLLQKGGVWNSYRPLMLRARCVSSMARFLFPDIIGGASHTPEELGARLDSRGNIVAEISKAEVVNASAVELETPLPANLAEYVIPIGAAKGKKLGELGKDSLAKVRSFLKEQEAAIPPEGRELLRVLNQYLGEPPQEKVAETVQEAELVQEGNHEYTGEGG